MSVKSLEPRPDRLPNIVWGLGLRPQFLRSLEGLLADGKEPLPLLEVMSDNLLFQQGGPGLLRTRRLAEEAQTVLHGIGLNTASADELDWVYIDALKCLADELGAGLISDHLSFSRSGGVSSFELLPIVRSKTYLRHVAERVLRIQDRWKTQLVLENVSAYVEHAANEMTEGEFFTELSRQTGCGVLLDVNNLYVNSVNFGFDPFIELLRFPLRQVEQFHIAGHTERHVVRQSHFGMTSAEDFDFYLFDTHDRPAHDQVVMLLQAALLKLTELQPQRIPVVIEWDDPKATLTVALTEITRIKHTLSALQDAALLPGKSVESGQFLC